MNPKVVHQSSSFVEKIQIEKLLAVRESHRALKERMALIEQALESAESEIINLLDAGAGCPPGYQLAVQETERRYPKWKEHFIDHMGKVEADIVLQETPPTISRRLVVK